MSVPGALQLAPPLLSDPGTAAAAARIRTEEPENVASLARMSGLLGAEALARAELVAHETGERLEAVLTRLGLISEQALADAFAAATDLPVLNAADLPAAPVAAESLSAAFLRDVHALPVAIDSGESGQVIVALANPLDRFAVSALAFALRRPVRRAVIRASDLEAGFERLYGRDSALAGGIDLDAMADEADLERLKDMASDAPVIRAVNRIVAAAVATRASDIHIEPTDDRLAVRFRIDGVLQEQEALPAAMRMALVSRIKIMAALNIAEKRLPQDGRMRLAVRGNEIDLRVATAPSIHGESVVLRILDRSNLALDFASLGFDADLSAKLLPILHRPHGIVLVTGPTGSGKTTTLYAALAELNTADRKLLTVEDPIEYRLPGVIQTQVAPGIGLGFSAALRSFLRQDPDVMMVGEIRDIETAQVAVQAALTGHTILSTLHTNTAAGAVTRLIDMGVEPFLIASSLNAVLAQRLVRRLCPHCRVPAPVPPELRATLGSHLAATDSVYAAVGCEACGGSGYRGRVAVLELLIMDETLARLVLQRAEAREIERAAVASGMRSLLRDGIAKARDGLTTLEEVLRVANDG
ncbi:ATPase, T2SS/T4P/T4SS family [Sandarakinorhabdus sp.]|uniref:GspE/PulE family protein n=1 Tax=Sandarakinorhabdus sp. TaxID=1916663 RepID=UPI00286E0913|nr:ATPase, T2SS/T4P/T4SS family [Sandarakinorhabdus sp.]